MTSGRKRLSVGIALVAMVFAGLGSVASAQSSGSTKAKGTPIKVGMVCTCSGQFGAAFGAGASAFQAWVKATNAAGGVQGHPIQVLVEDDAGDPGTGTSAAQKLVGEHVVAMVDLSLVSGAWNQIIKDAKLPTIAGPTAVQNPYTFWAGQTTGGPTANESSARVAKSTGKTKIGQLYCAESPSCTENAGALAGTAEKLGMKVVYKATFASNAPSYTSQCLAAKDAGVEVMLVGSQPSTISKVAADCATQGFNPIYEIGVISWSPSMLTAPGLKDGTYGASGNYPFFDTTLPEIKTMQKALNKYYPDILAKNNTDTPGELVVNMWASGVLLGKAAEAGKVTADTKTVTSTMLLNGLYALKGETLNGLAPPLTYSAANNNIVTCWFTAHFKGGKYLTDNNGKSTCPTGA